MKTVVIALAILFTLLRIGNGQPMPNPSFVAQDGSGNFRTINEAIKAATNYSRQKQYIIIKEGVYYENVVIQLEKTNIVLIGKGTQKTVITGKRSNASGFGLEESATVGILGSGFMAWGITFSNTAGPDGNQAVAVHARAEELTFYQCQFIGYQDTLYANQGSIFFRDCVIKGTIDFIFGDSRAVFQNCIIQAQQPLSYQYVTITAQGRAYLGRTGFIFQNCTVQSKADSHIRCYLGRPWKDFSRVVFMQSFIDAQIDPHGWVEWNGKAPVHPFFAEYDNKGPRANISRRVKWSRVITKRTEASQFTVRNFLEGGTWIPRVVPRYVDLL